MIGATTKRGATFRVPHKEKINYKSAFSLTKNRSWKEHKANGYNVSSRTYTYHWLKANPGSSRYDIFKGTGIKESSLCKDLRVLEKEGMIYKAYDAPSKDSGKYVHHYKVREVQEGETASYEETTGNPFTPKQIEFDL